MTDPKEISFFGKEAASHDLAWYEASFTRDPQKRNAPFRGDISPWYSRATQQTVAAAHALLPDAKLILIIRNPVDRAWSQVLMDLGAHSRANLSTVSNTRLLQHCERQRHVRMGEYQGIIDQWTQRFPRESLHVTLYDRVKDDPEGFLRDILAHIGADPDWQPPQEMMRTRVWSSQEATGGKRSSQVMPEYIRWHLSCHWLESTKRLNDRMNGQLDGWITQMEDVVGRRAPARWHVLRGAHHVARWPLGMPYMGFRRVREFRLARGYKRALVSHAQKTVRIDNAAIEPQLLRDSSRAHPGENQASPTSGEARQDRARSKLDGFVLKPAIAGAAGVVLGTIVALAHLALNARYV